MDDLLVRAAGRSEPGLEDFLNAPIRIHRHLDWRHSLDWLGTEPFFIAEKNGEVLAALACPPDPPSVAWVRLFAHSRTISAAQGWGMIFPHLRQYFRQRPGVRLVALGLQDWFEELLIASGFVSQQRIVVLDWEGDEAPALSLADRAASPVHIRPMRAEDLAVVAAIDQAAFDPLWQISIDTLQLAFQQSAVSTVAELDGQSVGYQISTSIPFSGHLARLAVMPGFQRRHIGQALVQHLMAEFLSSRVWHITVNTQSNNWSSLALYEKLHFNRTGENYPVYELAF